MVKYLILHCTATPEGRHISPGWLLDLFKLEFGWSKPGYRKFVDINGQAYDLIDYNNDDILEWPEVTYGAKGFNQHAIHVSYAGGVSRWNIKVPKDTRTEEQIRFLRSEVDQALAYHPEIKIGGHNMFNPHKACPSFDVTKWLNQIGVPIQNVIQEPIVPRIKRVVDSGMFDFNPNTINKVCFNV